MKAITARASFISPDEIENYNDKENIGSLHDENHQIKKCSVMKTEYCLNVRKILFSEVGEARKIEDIPADELNILSSRRFIMGLIRKDGGAYEPPTLQSFQRSLQRYLNDKNSKINFLKDREFLKSREVLLSKQKQLVVEEAKGNCPHAAQELSDVGHDLLFRSG